jgi:hypothetical protein
MLEPPLPFEFVVSGTAISSQASSASKAAWKATVEAAARAALPEGAWLLTDPLDVTIYLFPEGDLVGDEQIERIVLQKFEAGKVFSFTNPSQVLAEALDAEKPVVYVRITNDLHEELS